MDYCATRRQKEWSTSSKPLSKKWIQPVVLPRALRRSFLELVHSKLLSDHMGRNHTTYQIRDIVWWPRMSDDITTFVKGCDACQRHKRTKIFLNLLFFIIYIRQSQQTEVFLLGPLNYYEDA